MKVCVPCGDLLVGCASTEPRPVIPGAKQCAGSGEAADTGVKQVSQVFMLIYSELHEIFM